MGLIITASPSLLEGKNEEESGNVERGEGEGGERGEEKRGRGEDQ